MSNACNNQIVIHAVNQVLRITYNKPNVIHAIKHIYFFFPHESQPRGGTLHLAHLEKSKLTIIDLFCEILNNFTMVLVFSTFKLPQSGVVVHLKKLIN